MFSSVTKGKKEGVVERNIHYSQERRNVFSLWESKRGGGVHPETATADRSFPGGDAQTLGQNQGKGGNPSRSSTILARARLTMLLRHGKRSSEAHPASEKSPYLRGGGLS